MIVNENIIVSENMIVNENTSPLLIIIVSSNNVFYCTTYCFPTSLNVMMSSKEQGRASWEHCNMCVVVSSALPQACGVSCVERPLLSLCLGASVPRAQTLEAFPRGPWTVVTFRHLFVKVNNAYVRFIAKSLPPFVASSNFCWEVLGCTHDRKQSDVW